MHPALTSLDAAQGDERGWLQCLCRFVHHQHIKVRARLEQLTTSSAQRAQLKQAGQQQVWVRGCVCACQGVPRVWTKPNRFTLCMDRCATNNTQRCCLCLLSCRLRHWRMDWQSTILSSAANSPLFLQPVRPHALLQAVGAQAPALLLLQQALGCAAAPFQQHAACQAVHAADHAAATHPRLHPVLAE